MKQKVIEAVILRLTSKELKILGSLLDINEACYCFCEYERGKRECHKCPVQRLFDKVHDECERVREEERETRI